MRMVEQDLDQSRSLIERGEKWREWSDRIRPLHFDSRVKVRIIPPFTGALTRFVCTYKDKQVSVYFDVYSRLGCMYDNDGEPIPYYEAYPINEDTRRYLLGDEDDLMKDIMSELGLDKN